MLSDSEIVARVVHLSDIHFGLRDPDAVWNALVKFVLDLKPSAILITGDIVNTPKTKLFELARIELGKFGVVPVLICPGNHDRHWFGNALGNWRPGFTRDFFYFLRGWYEEAPKFRVLSLGPRITARVTAIDSSDKSSYFARSFVDEKTCNELAIAVDNKVQDAAEAGKLNLRIVMTHHHLLPVCALEAKKDKLLGPFQSATTLTVNAGTVLKKLSEGHVDLVLHGHEHEKNVAKYTTLENRLGNVTVVGAGSSTGTVTGEGWSFDRANFNVIEVCDDDSVWLSTYRGSSGAPFSIDSRHKLFEAVDLRRARFYLTHNMDKGEAQELKIHFRFLDNRDIIVHRSYVNTSLSDNKYTFKAYSNTGMPFDPKVWLLDKNGDQIPGDVGAGFVVDTNKTNAWRCEAKFPAQSSQSPHHVFTGYRWKGAGLLSEDDVDRLPAHLRGCLYTDYLEHVYCVIPSGMKIPATLDISVDLPSQWAPNDRVGNVLAYTQTEKQDRPEHSAALTKTIYSSGEGHYALRVDYPDPKAQYFLAWRVRKAPKQLH